ncbi:MAG TPA: O-antigen ligase family protein [Terriglobales bacterium]|nr:O-antigen ligase family protein [Terriglobales bacterium]
MATATAKIPISEPVENTRTSFAYRVMLVFSFLYYFRPGDVIPHLSSVPLAKITGAVAVLALIFGSKNQRISKLPAEVKLIAVMFVWMVLIIPFSSWRMGSINVVFFEFSKALIIAVTLTLTVSRFSELKLLVLMQASGVALMTFASIIVNHRFSGRLAGIGDSLLSNPNDLALNVAINWPLCLAFFIGAKRAAARVFWGVSLLAMAYAVLQTYSRSGFLALILGGVVCLWEFAIRGRRLHMLIATVLCLLLAVGLSPNNYGKRLATLVGHRERGDKDRGSAEARENLLLDSLEVTATHPFVGVGPGNFDSYTRTWRVTHNTYTELSSECGVPALVMFLILLRMAFRNVGRVRKSKLYDRNSEVRLLSSALFATLCAYLLGAFFSSTAYQLFSYYMVTYTILLYKVALAPNPVTAPAKKVVDRAYTPALAD